MSSRTLSHLTVVVFVLLGTLCFIGRYRTRLVEQTAQEESLWRLTYNVKFAAKSDDAVVRVALPNSSTHSTVVNEELWHPNLAAEMISGRNREVRLRAKHIDSYEFRAEVDIQLRPHKAWPFQRAAEALTLDTRARYLRRETNLPVQSSEVQRMLQSAPRGEATREELLQWVFETCSRDLRQTTADKGGDDVDWALANMEATPLGKARAMVTLCRAARLPARLVTGIELRQSTRAREHVWVEVFRGHHWIPFDPTYGYARNMPTTFVPLRRGSEQAVLGTGVENLERAYSVMRLAPETLVLESEKRHPSQILDLTRLPLEMHEIMSLMLLLPLGALITALMRNVVGIRTFGTFAPALLAMSFIYAAWGTGIVILVVVVAAGLFGRVLLDRLHLLMVPRLSVILTTIILFVAFGVSLLDYLDVTPSAQAVLLPLVILTLLIERFYVATEEDGIFYSMQLVAGTLVVASLCYVLLRWDDVGQFMLVYPEAHLLTIAAFILVGRYAGYRLTELWRFRDIVDSSEPTK